ncbi:MAG: hypothetical protein KAH38_08345 [Candidatus Hydrogenedentes bacterium]|nr:hypothetical protein [Candidatus Hydrogenedentota bacterium]
MNSIFLCLLCNSMLLVTAKNVPLEVFTPTDTAGEFQVKTDFIEGKLRADGLSNGFAPLQYISPETNLTSMMGLLNYYRVFTTNHRFGASMRALPSEATLEAADTLRVYWPAAEDRPFTLTGVYHWVAPDTVDLETIVEAKELLPDFEIFLSSYLSPNFPVSSVYVKAADHKKGYMTAEEEGGVWQAFPRDEEAVKIIKDGRWNIGPSPVDWAVRPELAAPIIYRRNEDTGLTIAMMARREDCFAVFTPHRAETHHSMYFSLFGKTLTEGSKAHARIRMIIAVMDDAALLKRYEEFLNSTTNTSVSK